MNIFFVLFLSAFFAAEAKTFTGEEKNQSQDAENRNNQAYDSLEEMGAEYLQRNLMKNLIIPELAFYL